MRSIYLLPLKLAWINDSFTEKELECDLFFATCEWRGDKWVVVDMCWRV